MAYSLYSKEVMKHFKKPQNLGKIKDADGIGEAGNFQCGDIMKLYIKIKKDKKVGKKKISEVKFECLGCVVAIANTSLLTTMIKGKSLEDAMKIKKEDILKKFGKIPITKIHCSILAVDALSEAIYDYYKKNNIEIPKNLLERHLKIKQTIESLEKRHPDYTGFERKVMK